MTRGILLTVAALALAGAAAVPRSAEAPPAGFSGGFGEPSCANCHLGSPVNAFGGSVALSGLPERYEAGREYVLTVALSAEETSVAGFQLTARWAEGGRAGTNAGRLAPVDARTATKDSLGVTYAHQTPAGAAGRTDGSGATWTVAWTAPTEAGPVLLHIAANSGNADNSPLGDLVYTHEAGVAPGS